MDDLLASFMPKFKELASTRLARSIEIAQKRDHDNTAAIARDLHAVAGEAGLLGLAAIVPLARAGEEHAKRLRVSRSDEDADALLQSLAELKRAIDLVAPDHQPERNP
jgi:HPt (histidine-containing phosphotransfer) domain-containing protein